MIYVARQVRTSGTAIPVILWKGASSFLQGGPRKKLSRARGIFGDFRRKLCYKHILSPFFLLSFHKHCKAISRSPHIFGARHSSRHRLCRSFIVAMRQMQFCNTCNPLFTFDKSFAWGILVHYSILTKKTFTFLADAFTSSLFPARASIDFNMSIITSCKNFFFHSRFARWPVNFSFHSWPSHFPVLPRIQHLHLILIQARHSFHNFLSSQVGITTKFK